MIGIYCITNKLDNKRYIGQSINIKKRLYEHKHSCENIPLRNAIRKYGWSNFDIEIIKTISDSKLAHVLLDSYESFYIKKYNTNDRQYGYNRTSGGSSGKRLTEDAKKHIGDMHRGWHPTEKQRARMSFVAKGKGKSNEWRKTASLNWHNCHTIESIESMANKLRGRTKSEEHKRKLSEATKKCFRQKNDPS